MRVPTFIALNAPQSLEPREYVQLLDKLVDHYSGQQDIVAVYQLGDVSVPGVSDLDLLIVYHDDTAGYNHEEYFRTMNDCERYVFAHGPMVITRGILRNIEYIYVLGNHRLLFGEALKTESLSNNSILRKIIAAEFMLGTLFTIMRAIDTKVLKIRAFLCILNAFKYDLEVSGLDRSRFPIGWQLVDSIVTLRKHWFDSSKAEGALALWNIITAAPHVIMEALEYIEEDLVAFVRSNSPWSQSMEYGMNRHVTVSPDDRCGYAIRRSFIASLLRLLPYSRLSDDTKWVFSDYIVRIPHALHHFLAGAVDSKLGPLLSYRARLMNYYIRFHKKMPGSTILLSSLRMDVPVSNVKWRSLARIKRMSKARPR